MIYRKDCKNNNRFPPSILPLLHGLTSLLLSAPAVANQVTQQDLAIYPIPTQMQRRVELPAPAALLTFSPDGQQLALATLHLHDKKSSLGPIWLSAVQRIDLANPAVFHLLIPAAQTAEIAFYGAPPIRLSWQEQSIDFVTSDGDEQQFEFHYTLEKSNHDAINRTQLHENEVIQPEPIVEAIKTCFSDWSPEIVATAFNGTNPQWRASPHLSTYQAQYANVADDIWYLDVNHCQRRPIITTSTAYDAKRNPHQATAKPSPAAKNAVDDNSLTPLAGQRIILRGTVQQSQQLLVLLDRFQHATQRHHSRILVTKLPGNFLGDSPIQWRDLGISINGNTSVAWVGRLTTQTLMLLESNEKPCKTRLLRLTAEGLSEIVLDGDDICHAALAADGTLALAITPKRARPSQNAKDAFVRPEFNPTTELVLVSADFLTRLPL